MRVGVLGAGAVGGALAALLDRGGHTVEVTARGAQLEAIREGGIRLSGTWGSHTARVEARDMLTHMPDLVIVATKAADAPAAISASADVIRGAPVLIVQNGLSGLESASVIVPDSPIAGGLAMFAASYLSVGEARITTGGPLYIGGDPTCVSVVVDVLGAVIEVRVVDNFIGAQWTKLVINQINALPAITGLSAQEVIAHRGLRRVMTASIRENVRVARALGIRFETMNGLSDALLRFVGFAPLTIGEVVPRAMARRMGETPNPGSTQQSIRRGQPTEIDFLNGAVVAAASPLGVRTPVNAALVALVHEVEHTHEFLAPAAVVAQVPLP